jgi:hypothetical protein
LLLAPPFRRRVKLLRGLSLLLPEAKGACFTANPFFNLPASSGQAHLTANLTTRIGYGMNIDIGFTAL